MSGARVSTGDGSWAETGRPPRRVAVLDAVAILVAFALGAWAVWPVYGTLRGPGVVLGGLVLGALVAWAGRRGRWTWWRTTVAGLVVYLVAVVPLAVPSALGDLPSNLGFGAREAVQAPVTAWKALASTPLPVGSFGSLLVPAFVVALVAGVVALTIVWRRPSRAAWAVLPSLAPLLFAIVWGPRESSVAVTLGRLEVAQPREVAWGGAWLVVMVCWLALRARWSVHQVRYLDASGRSRRSSGGVVRRTTLGAGMVLVAVAVAVLVAPGWADGRTVARSVVEPQTVAQPQVSPLSGFRSFFEPGTLDAPLFTVRDAADGTRLRVATLAFYDGDVYEVLDPSAPGAGLQRLAFRIPDTDPSQATGPARSVTVTSDGYSGAWVPTVGRPVSVSFQGTSARTLDSSLFADPATGSVLSVAERGNGAQGVVPGDVLHVDFRAQAVAPDAAQASGRSPLVSQDDAPALFTWIAAQGVGGATVGDVRTLVDAMMQRSYLGHSLQEPVAGNGEQTWVSEIGDDETPYAFLSSFAGHNLARVDDGVFAAMNAAAVRCGAVESCAATVGDQEQYAVAAALIAQAKGFPARVVLGADVPDDGVVRGGDMTAWAEIEAADGTWATLDVVPRTDNVFVDDETATTPERVPTTVDEQEATELEAPAQKPQSGDAPTARDSPQEQPATSSWWPLVRAIGWGVLALVVLLAPFVLVLVGKSLRRRRRRGAPAAEARIAGGWEEYVDAHLDAGAPAVGTRTRSEVAALYGGPSGGLLAERADRAVFGDVDPGDAEADEFWRIVAAELDDVRRTQGWARRWRSAVSLRSVRNVR